MNKIWLIIQREYLSRVMKKSFILTTLLMPVGFVVFIAAVILIQTSGKEEAKILVKDDAGLLAERGLKSDEFVNFEIDRSGVPLDSLLSNKNYQKKGKDGVLYLEKGLKETWNKTISPKYYSEKVLGNESQNRMENRLADVMRQTKIANSGYNKDTLNLLDTDVNIQTLKVDKDGKSSKNSASLRGMLIGGALGLLIYAVIFTYGSMVMRSVMEEKTNRVVEIMVSSVKPFELMLGKIIGVGAVGLTQFGIWAILIPLLNLLMGLIFASQLEGMADAQNAMATGSAVGQEEIMGMMDKISDILDFNYAKVGILFVLYFLGGYFLYAALFAAVSSAIGDDIAEGQSLVFPIMMPIIIAFYIGAAAIQNPNSSMAFWSSLVPFFSPIIMPVLLGFDNTPWWQIILSLVLLYGSATGIVWLAGRIFRVGILMYGKKASYKEIIKWVFAKG